MPQNALPVAVQPHSVIDLVWNAGIVVQLVLLILIFLSVLSWAVILMKMKQLRIVRKQNQGFLNLFWNSQSMDDVYEKAEQYFLSSIAMVFKSGFREFKKIAPEDAKRSPQISSENLQRALFKASQEEVQSLEKNVSILATTASAAPFIGLFGTVWGIMTSFRDISQTGAASLAVVAPGISEALIATSIGLFAAIPAVIAYNTFLNQIRGIVTDTDVFSQDFINIVQRSLLSGGH